MPDVNFLKTVSFEEAQRVIKKNIVIGYRTEEISLKIAFNRILAEDFYSRIDVPGFNRSLRDGFAVIAQDTFGAEEDSPVTLKLIEEIKAGEFASKTLESGQCIQISTGAPVPKGANAIIMVEFTEQVENQVKIYKAATPTQYITKVGTDIKKNQIALNKNTILSPKALGTLAALGCQKVLVYAKPRVSILSTGDELISLNEQISPGKIYDINATTLYNAVLDSQGFPISLGIAPDNIEAITRKIKKMVSISDIIIVTGGTSKGKGDLLPEILSNFNGIEFIIHGVRIKPGKPIIISSVQSNSYSIPIFVLPGNPTSCLITYDLFIDPLIRQFTFFPQKKMKIVKARLKRRVYSSEGRTVFQPVKIVNRSKSKIEIIPVHTGSESITTLSHSEGYIIIPEEIQFLEENEIIDLYLF